VTLKELNALKEILLIIIRVVITFTLSKINEEMMITTLLNFANLLTLKSVLKEINVGERITELSDFIIKTSIKQSFVTSFQIKFSNVSMAIIALSLIL
jgi:hypothetical protein